MPKSKAKKEADKVKAMQKLTTKTKEKEEEEKRRHKEFKEKRDKSVSKTEKFIMRDQIAANILFQMTYIYKESTLIHLPPFRAAKFYSVLKAIYGNGVDFRKNNPSHSSPFSIKEESELITEDGGLYLDRFLHQFTTMSFPLLKADMELLDTTTHFSAHGLAHYNDNHKGDEYELVAPLYYKAFQSSGCVYEIHGNFLARRKDSEVVRLFYYVYSTGSYADDPVVRCTIMTPVSQPTDLDRLSEVEVLHPQDVRCHCCRDKTDDDY